jgi:CSLREA domain-containing protein
VGLLLAYASSPAWAATITVNSLEDTAANDGKCTLRETITSANTDTAFGGCVTGSGDDVINIGVTGTVDLTAELPDLSTNIEMVGPGSDQLTVTRPDTAEHFRIFTVTGDTTEVTISGMTISNGNTLEVDDRGGGISNEDNGTLTITNSTISGNTAQNGGGGVYNTDGLTKIEFSTITKNTAPNDQGSGVASVGNDRTSTEVLSSIISANQGTDVDFVNDPTNTFVSRGYNLIGDGNATGAFNQTTDQTDVTDPGLDPLGSYGGPTQTHRLQPDSLAVDAGPPTDGDPIACPPPATDQRGVTRPQDGDGDSTSICDIGSFELEVAPDTQAPRVISTFPRNGGELGPAANIRATFSEDMREASVMRAFKLFRKGSTNQIAARVSYDAATDIATLNPNNNLRKGATYKAVVSTLATDVAGNRLDQNSTKSGLQKKVWFFEID